METFDHGKSPSHASNHAETEFSEFEHFCGIMGCIEPKVATICYNDLPFFCPVHIIADYCRLELMTLQSATDLPEGSPAVLRAIHVLNVSTLDRPADMCFPSVLRICRPDLSQLSFPLYHVYSLIFSLLSVLRSLFSLFLVSFFIFFFLSLSL